MPSPTFTEKELETKGTIEEPNEVIIPKSIQYVICGLLLLVATWFLLKPNAQTDQSLVVSTKNFGNVDVLALTTFQARDIGSLLKEIKASENPEEKLYTEDDLVKLTKFLQGGTCNPELLAWAIGFLDRVASSDLKDKIKSKICAIDPSFCGQIVVNDSDLIGWKETPISLETYIDEFNISVRLYNILRAEKILQIKDIEKFLNSNHNWESAFRRFRNVGRKTHNEFKKIVEKLLEYKVVRYY